MTTPSLPASPSTLRELREGRGLTALDMVNRAIDDADDARILLDLIGDICGNISRKGMTENDSRLLTQIDTLALRTTKILEGVVPQIEALHKATQAA